MGKEISHVCGKLHKLCKELSSYMRHLRQRAGRLCSVIFRPMCILMKSAPDDAQFLVFTVCGSLSPLSHMSVKKVTDVRVHKENHTLIYIY